jgi:hypothetical protein
LRLYDDFICISHLAQSELAQFLGRPSTGAGALTSVVAWPRDVLPPGEVTKPSNGSGPIVVMTGDEPRKNTFGALAAIGAATAGDEQPRDVVVIGMAGHETRVHHWSIAAAMRPGEARTVGRLSDSEMHDLLASASLVVVASFDEGLSLPVIEALRAGTPVVASDIPSHRELIGKGSYLADPASPGDLERAVRHGPPHQAARCRRVPPPARHLSRGQEDADSVKSAAGVPRSGPRRWRALTCYRHTVAPQRSGVADFSTTTTLEPRALQRLVHQHDVTGSAPDDITLAAPRSTALLAAVHL